MEPMLSAQVPRNLRIHASLQIAGIRVPLGSFVIALGALLIGGIAIVTGADPAPTIQRLTCAAAIVIGLREARFWGYGSGTLLLMLCTALLRPGQLELRPLLVDLPPEAAPTEVPQLRWHQKLEE
ncbi:MAG TPA: hypothetical protein PKA05_07970 [Roseiflexaceae bacterium]|nr:hypothetical protein [Roseiflexaceae bacterium]HMP40300.1 hypothetical protein [Roseiflexaceae bacterium]